MAKIIITLEVPDGTTVDVKTDEGDKSAPSPQKDLGEEVRRLFMGAVKTAGKDAAFAAIDPYKKCSEIPPDKLGGIIYMLGKVVDPDNIPF